MDIINNFLKNDIVFSIIVVFLVFYGPHIAPIVSKDFFLYFKHPVFRFIVVFVLLFLATRFIGKGYFSGTDSSDMGKGDGRLVLIVLIVFFAVMWIANRDRKKSNSFLYKEQFTDSCNVPTNIEQLESSTQINNNVDECLTCPGLKENEKSTIADYYSPNTEPIEYPHEPDNKCGGTMKKLWEGSVADMNSMRSYTNK